MKKTLMRMLGAALGICLATTGSATTRYVSNTGANTAPYDTPATAARALQTVVDYSINGDEIYVLPGLYRLTAPVLVKWKALLIQASDPSNMPVFDGQGITGCFYISDVRTTLRSLRIINGIGYVGQDGATRYGGGVYVANGGIIENCTIQNCSADFGGGVRLYAGGSIVNTLISGCAANDSGGGVLVSHAGEIVNCDISGNVANAYGGGIYFYQGGTGDQLYLHGNGATHGGGVRIYYKDPPTASTAPQLSRSRLVGNWASTRTFGGVTYNGTGGAIQLAYQGTVDNCLVYDNAASLYGGGVALYRGGDVVNCTISYNFTSDTDGDGVGDGWGGGLYADSGGSRIVNSVIFWNKGRADRGKEYFNWNTPVPTYQRCLTDAWPGGDNPFPEPPLFVDGNGRNLELMPNSPCIDDGVNKSGLDFAGDPRQLDGTGSATYTPITDIGAYEYGYRITDDADGDGMPSGWEVDNGLNPNDQTDAAVDTDSDGLINLDEYTNSGDPQNPDTDGDLVLDGEEVHFYSSKVDDPDTDDDGAGDRAEADALYNPNDATTFSKLTDPGQVPAYVSGTISYVGTQTGTVFVLAGLTSSTTVGHTSMALLTEGVANNWSGTYRCPTASTNFPTQKNYYFSAFLDTNGNGVWDTWEARGAYVTQPLFITQPATTVNMVLSDPGTDTDQDGLSDYEEIYGIQAAPTDPYVPDTDGDGMWDGWEVLYSLNPNSPFDQSQDPDLDGLTSLMEFLLAAEKGNFTWPHTGATNPQLADTDGDSMDDGWEVGTGRETNNAALWLNPLVQDGSLDPDLDGLVNSNEYLYGSHPFKGDTDADGMPDGWEVFVGATTNTGGYSLDPTDPTDWGPANDPNGKGDPDFDGLSNLDEYRATVGTNLWTDPHDPDTDNDGMPDVEWLFGLNPHVNDAYDDPDGDGLTSLQEMVQLPYTGANSRAPYHPHPTLWDTDSDGANDGREVAVGTDPTDPNSFPATIQGTALYSGVQTGLFRIAATSYADMVTTNATRTYNASTFVAPNSVYSVVDVAGLLYYEVAGYLDSNTNQVQDTWEASGYYFTTSVDTNGVTNVTTRFQVERDTNGMDFAFLDPISRDSDGDELSDMEEHYTFGTDPYDGDTDGDGMPDGWEAGYIPAVDPLVPDANLDPDGDSLINFAEYTNSTPYRTNPGLADSDGDGLRDDDELFTHGTNPNAVDTDGDGVSDFDELNVYGTDPLDPDTDGDGASDGLEVDVLSDPLDVSLYPTNFSGLVTYAGPQLGDVYITMDLAPTNGPYRAPTLIGALGAYTITDVAMQLPYTIGAFLDGNTNAVRDPWEPLGSFASNPLVVTSGVVGVNINLDNPTDDTDLDGLPDYDEIWIWDTDPNNPDTDGDSMLDGWEVGYGLDPKDPADALTDNPDLDGLINSNEHALGTDPTNSDSDGDSMPDGWEFDNSLNPAVDDAALDPDNDFLANGNEFTENTDPQVPDTDGDGFRDGTEVDAGSSPIRPESYPVSVTGTTIYTDTFQTGDVVIVFELTPGDNWRSRKVGPVGAFTATNIANELSYYIHAYIDDTPNMTNDAWEATGVYTNNPVSLALGGVGGIDITLSDPPGDSDGDGISDVEEVFVYGTNPFSQDTDSDTLLDKWEIDFGFSPTNAYSITNSLMDGEVDVEPDGLDNTGEQTAGSDPNNPDSDGDTLLDGWEVLYGFSPTNAFGIDGINRDDTLDPDLDFVTNSTEQVAGTDPTNPDTDGDGLTDRWELDYAGFNATTNDSNGNSILDGDDDHDADGLINSDEQTYGTDPNNPNTDGDPATDREEVDAGSDPLNPLSFPVDISGTVTYGGAQTGQVYVAFSLSTNVVQDLHRQLDATLGVPYTATNLPGLTNFYVYAFMDLDGNSAYDPWDPIGAYPANPLLPTNDTAAVDILITDSLIDSDGDGLTDFDEVFVHLTDPFNPFSDGDAFTDYEEVQQNTDPLDPASFPARVEGTMLYSGIQTGRYTVVVSYDTASGVEVLRTYADEITGAYVVTSLPTLYNYWFHGFVDTDANGTQDTWEAWGDWSGSPSIISNDLTGVDIPMTNSTADTDLDGLSDHDEVYGTYSNIVTDPYNPDTDGDSMPDGWEVTYYLLPNNPGDAGQDPDGDLLVNSNEYIYGTSPRDPDSDGDTVTDGDEVNIYGTTPTDPDTDGDGMPDGWEISYLPALDPLVNDASVDLEPDLVLNIDEYRLGTSPTNIDTDAEGLTDYEEAYVYNTSPTIPDTDADGWDDYMEVKRIESDPNYEWDPVVVNPEHANDPGPSDPWRSNPNENGRLNTAAFPAYAPFDEIQKGVDVAVAGQTVLVMGGGTNSHRTGAVVMKDNISVRSLDGPSATIIQDTRGGFVCGPGVTTNAVIQGFTIQSRVVELGADGIVCNGGSPTVRDCVFFDCGGRSDTAGISCRSGATPQIEDCQFELNEQGLIISDSSPYVLRSTFTSNYAAEGAAMHISGVSDPYVANCLFALNTATNRGGAFYVASDSSPLLEHCTIADNAATNSGGGFFNQGSLRIWNSIVWGNTAPIGPGFTLTSPMTVRYSCLQTYNTGSGNIQTDPRFEGGGSYGILPISPCVDTASDFPEGNPARPVDIEGQARPNRIYFGPSYTGFDMGAYEYYSVGTLAVTAPGATVGESIAAGLPAEIQWTWTGAVSTNVRIELTYDDINNPYNPPAWINVTAGTFAGSNNVGSFIWNVPAVTESVVYLRLTDTANSLITAVTDNPFAIAPQVRLTAPNGGEEWPAGSTNSVEWLSSTTSNATVTLVYAPDGQTFGPGQGITLGTVANASGSNTFSWAIPSNDATYLSTNGRVRVRYADASSEDISDAPFVVSGIAVIEPMPNVTVASGDVVRVSWRSAAVGASVDIAVTTNGVNFTAISNGVANMDGSNTFDWTVSMLPASNAMLRIQSVATPSLLGMSGNFTVTASGAAPAADADGDGLLDSWEAQVGLSSLSATGYNGAAGDPDGDGFSNLSEMIAGTDPLNGRSNLGISAAWTAPSGAMAASDTASGVLRVVTWSTVPGRRYRVEYADSPGGLWQALGTTMLAEGWEATVVDRVPAGQNRFYRVIVLSN